MEVIVPIIFVGSDCPHAPRRSVFAEGFPLAAIIFHAEGGELIWQQ
jgi:hypothetical protein